MKYLILCILFCTITAIAFSQDANASVKYAVKEKGFEWSAKPIGIEYLTITTTKDSLFFKTDKLLALGGIAYSDIFLPDSVSSESTASIKKDITYAGIKYTALLKAINKNGITEKITLTIDGNEILSVSNKKSFHCTNHDLIVHHCPTAPRIAKPPCETKDCIWAPDN